MSKVDEMSKFVSQNFVKERLAKSLGRWSTVIQFRLDGEAPFHFVVDGGSFEVRKGEHQKPKTVVSGSASALEETLSGDIDVTHPIAAGKLRLVSGDYFDLLNLSRAALAARK